MALLLCNKKSLKINKICFRKFEKIYRSQVLHNIYLQDILFSKKSPKNHRYQKKIIPMENRGDFA